MKDEILQTALDQFLKYGIREISIKRLIEPLGISTKTVYKYFKNKEDVLEQALKLHYEQQYQLLQNLTSNSRSIYLLVDTWSYAVERVYDVSTVFYHDLHYYYPALEQKIEVGVGRKFGAQFIALLDRGKAEGDFHSSLNSEVAMEGIYILYNAITRTDLFERYGVSPHEIIRNTIFNYIRGMCTTKGLMDLEKHLENK